MTFFQAQKKLIRLWFLWSMILLAYISFQTIISSGVFSPPEVATKIWEWIAKYLASIFALIIGSSFFEFIHTHNKGMFLVVEFIFFVTEQ